MTLNFLLGLFFIVWGLTFLFGNLSLLQKYLDLYSKIDSSISGNKVKRKATATSLSRSKIASVIMILGGLMLLLGFNIF